MTATGQPGCVRFTAWQYELPEGRFWSWACSCGRTLATHGSDPLAIRTMDEAVDDAAVAHGRSPSCATSTTEAPQ